MDQIEMKMFVWEGDGVLTDYTNGMICAIAEDLDAAHKAIAKNCNYAEGNYPPTPTEVYDLPGTHKSVTPKAWTCWGGG